MLIFGVGLGIIPLCNSCHSFILGLLKVLLMSQARSMPLAILIRG